MHENHGICFVLFFLDWLLWRIPEVQDAVHIGPRSVRGCGEAGCDAGWKRTQTCVPQRRSHPSPSGQPEGDQVHWSRSLVKRSFSRKTCRNKSIWNKLTVSVNLFLFIYLFIFVLGSLAALQRSPCEPGGHDDDAGQPGQHQHPHHLRQPHGQRGHQWHRHGHHHRRVQHHGPR